MALSSHLIWQITNVKIFLLEKLCPSLTIQQESFTHPVAHLLLRHSTQVIVEESEFNSFPDELSQFATSHLMEDSASSADCDVCYQGILQLMIT
jgi:hypothetical protein